MRSFKINHSPGEWQAATYKSFVGFSLHAGNRGCITERWYDFEQTEPYASEMIHNADLIASAPEMSLILALLSRGLARFEINNSLSEFCFDGMRYVWRGDAKRTVQVIGRDKIIKKLTNNSEFH